MKKRWGGVFLFLFILGRALPVCAAAPVTAQDLVESLRDDDENNARASQQMLFNMGADAVRPLQKVLFDSNFRLRRRAVEVLARLGPVAKRAAPDLVLLLADPQYEVHDAAQKALIQMGDDAIPALSDALKSNKEGLRKVALGTMSRCGPKGIPIIIKLLKTDESSIIRADAAGALGDAQPATPEIINALIHAFADLEEMVRSATADSLGQQGAAAKAAIGPLLVAAQRDRDPLTRKKSADALLKIGTAGRESIEGFIACLHDPSEEVRRHVVDYLGLSPIPFADASPVLASALKDPDATVRMKVIQVTVAKSSPTVSAIPILKGALADSSVDVRAAAIEGFGRMTDTAPQAAAELLPLLSDANPVIREDTIHVLANLGEAGLPGLIRALSDNYSTLSDEAGKAIIRLGDTAVPALQALQQGPDPDLKRKATELLRRIQHKPARRKAR
jgi:HEAT repeat protein